MAKIPATVITGFLGAGKTSLIRYLLNNSGGRRLALIINEFGDVGIDRDILRNCGDAACREGDIVELANGCICCTVADDFLPTMKRLLDAPSPPDHIVIETSGLALPKPLVRAFNWPEIRTRVTVDGVIAVVDAAAAAEGRFATDEAELEAQRQADPNLDHESPLEELFEEQIACADMVILNKSDLLVDGMESRVTEAVNRHLRQGVRLVPASFGRIDPKVLLGLDAAAEDDLDSRHSHADSGDDHDHDDFESFIVSFGAEASPQAVLDKLSPLIAAHDVLRVKGFVAVEGKAMRLVVQGVGSRVQHYYDREWQAGEERASRLVVIGQKGLDSAAITAAIQA